MSMNMIILDIPFGYVKIAIENGPVEIVDLPINSMVIFHSYVNVDQRVSGGYGKSMANSVANIRMFFLWGYSN